MINLLKNYFKEHYWAIIFAIFIGGVIIAPQIIFIGSLGDSYKGLYMMKTDVELYYLSRMHQAYDGENSVSPFTYEYKYSVPRGTFSLAETILALPGIVLNISAPNLGLLYKFIFPFLIALLVYSLSLKIIKNKWWSIAVMFAVVLGYNLFFIPDIIHLLKFDMFHTGFTGYARPVYPQIASVLFFLYLNLLFVALKENKLKWYIYLAVIFGICFYIYIFLSTFILTLNIILVCMLLFQKRKRIASKMALVICGGLAISSYFVWNLIETIRHPYYADFAVNEKMVLSHMPIISIAGCITLVAFLFYLFIKKRFKKENISDAECFLLTLLLSAFAIVNQQIITGHLLQEGHYHWYFNIPIFAIILFYIAKNILRDKKRLAVIFLAVIIILSSWSTIFVEYSSYVYWHDRVKGDQRYIALLDWIKSNSKKDDVIFANENISTLVPLYTSRNVVWEYMAVNYMLPKERLLFTPENILKGDFEENVRKFRVDYVAWDVLLNPDWNMSKYKLLHEVWRGDGLILYSL